MMNQKKKKKEEKKIEIDPLIAQQTEDESFQNVIQQSKISDIILIIKKIFQQIQNVPLQLRELIDSIIQQTDYSRKTIYDSIESIYET